MFPTIPSGMPPSAYSPSPPTYTRLPPKALAGPAHPALPQAARLVLENETQRHVLEEHVPSLPSSPNFAQMEMEAFGFQIGGTCRLRHSNQDTTSTPATVPPDILSPATPLASRKSVDVSDPPLHHGHGHPWKQVVAQPSPPPAPGLPLTQASTKQPSTVPSPTPPTLFFNMVIHILLPDKLTSKAAKQDGSACIVLCMLPPTAVPTLPWVNCPAVDEDDQSEDDLTGPPKKKGKIDEDIEDLAAHIEDKYPAGLHYELTRPRRLAWVSAIHNDKASLTAIPLGSAFFKSDQALKNDHSSGLQASSSVLPPSSVSLSACIPPVASMSQPFAGPSAIANQLFAHTYPSSLFYSPSLIPTPSYFPYLPFQPMSMGMNVSMNMGVGMGVGIPGWHNPGPSFSSPSSCCMQSSPPPVDSSIDDFCDQYKVSLDDRACLDQLGFQIGDNISHIED
ncbi:hypothetical protein BDN71DRAFT_1435147 [Pleurotus eryngii]|uniref:Uncharacterized protein n=1 Tax=Pleurotus eryngii TaxID=5323 RepID=A0A9P5ZL40_PLEER|nr:hypothetical protein BDN71DRAFT_1435147 [Pleurotus eryngii]